MKNQYEQQCNALALKEMGVPVIKKLSVKNIKKIAKWIYTDKIISVEYLDNIEAIFEAILQPYANETILPTILS
jgi:hypothetical protein